MVETPKQGIKLNRDLILVLVVVASAAVITTLVVLLWNIYQNNKYAGQTTSEIADQQSVELNIFNQLVAKKINLESVQFFRPTAEVTIRIKSDQNVLTSQAVKNAWIALYRTYKDFNSVSAYNISVNSSEKQLMQISATRGDLANAVDAYKTDGEKAKLDLADPAMVSAILGKLIVKSDANVSQLLGQ